MNSHDLGTFFSALNSQRVSLRQGTGWARHDFCTTQSNSVLQTPIVHYRQLLCTTHSDSALQTMIFRTTESNSVLQTAIPYCRQTGGIQLYVLLVGDGANGGIKFVL